MTTTRADISSQLSDLHPRLWRYALVLSRRRDVADDLAQSAILRALEKAHQYQAGTRLDAWVFTILKSIWMNQLRANKVRLGAGVQPVEEIDIAATDPGVDVNILARQVLARIMDLPEAQRDTVYLTYIEGYSYKEVATQLDVPIGTVMSRLANARKKINHAMGEDLNNGKGR